MLTFKWFIIQGNAFIDSGVTFKAATKEQAEQNVKRVTGICATQWELKQE